MPGVALIFNAFPQNVPLQIQLDSGQIVPLVPGFQLTPTLLTSDANGVTDGSPSPLGTVTAAQDGISVDVHPTRTGQFGFALLRTAAQPPGRAGLGFAADVLLLFVDTTAQLIYDVGAITGGPLQH